MNFFKRLFAKNPTQPATSPAPEKPKGLIRFVFLAVTLPEAPTNPQMANFLMDMVPELKNQDGNIGKVGFLWQTQPFTKEQMHAKAAETFGPEITDASRYTYRTIQIKLATGEAKCLVVYEK